MTTADKRNSETSSPIRTYKVEDIAAMLNIGRTSAYNLVKEGHFKTVRIGNAIRISKKLVDCLEKCLICRHIRRFAD